MKRLATRACRDCRSSSERDDTNVQLRAVYDTRDSVALPTRGSFLNARYVRSADWFGGEQDYEIVEAVFAQVIRRVWRGLAEPHGGGREPTRRRGADYVSDQGRRHSHLPGLAAR